MSFEIFVSQLVNIILLPPGINLILAMLGYWLIKKSKKIAFSLLASSFISLTFFSLPAVSIYLNKQLITDKALTPIQVKSFSNSNETTAIVVLSGGRVSTAPEYGDIDTVSSTTLQRLQYTAWLHRKTGLPILLSGGSTSKHATSEAVLMNQTLLSSFNIAPKWIETKSENTAQNALFSAKILAEHQITQILLVTSSIHMQRAKIEFEKTGLKIIPAATIFGNTKDSTFKYLPTAKALDSSHKALHEMIGRIWYSIRY